MTTPGEGRPSSALRAPSPASGRRHTLTAILAVAALRFFRLGALPIFNDEAIYVRWGQILAADPWLSFAVPLIDPKPPLHPMLIAAALRLGFDPLLTGRAVSVIAAVLLVPALILLVRELDFPPRAAAAAVVLATAAPFLAFYQRLATADAMFVTQSVFCVWLALRLARGRKEVVLAFGAMLGLTMLTRQVFSLALLPVTFAAARQAIGRWLAGVAVAAIVFAPYLLSGMSRYREGIGAELRRRVLHHAEFTEAGASQRLAIIGRNLRDVFVPDSSGWLWHSLTPPVYVVSIAALIWLVFRRRAVAAILIIWLAALLAPTILFGAITYPRYALAAAMPLLIAAALGLADVIRRPLVMAIVLAALIVWPLRTMLIQATRWDQQPLLRVDRWQYISGWPAGHAMEQALLWTDARLERSGATLITGEGWGIPDDVVWMRYAEDRRVSLRFVQSKMGVPRLGETATYDATWSPAARPLPVPAAGPVYYFDRFAGGKTVPHDRAALAEDPIVFTNPEMEPGAPLDGIVVFRLR